jgi:hypothetical protein
MRGCGRVKKLISCYLEKDLDPGLQQEIAEHIKFCSECYETEKTLKRISAIARDLPEEEPSFDLAQKVMEKVGFANEAIPRTTRVFPAIRRWVWAMPATAVLVVLLFLINTRLNRDGVQLMDQQEQSISQQNTLPGQSVIPEGPVEFVIDNWNPGTRWQAASSNQSLSDSQMLGSAGWPGDSLPASFRMYVMPAAQNQMTGTTTRRPY